VTRRAPIIGVLAAVVFAAAVGVLGAADASVVWVVDNSVEESGDGSLESPLTTLAEAERRSAPGEWIFVRSGDGSTRGLDGGIELKPRQVLWGEGIAFESGSMVVPAGAPPTITNPDGHGVVVATGCEVVGLGIRATRDAGIYGAGVEGLRLRDLEIASTGGAGIELREAEDRVDLHRIRITGPAGHGIAFVSRSTAAPADLTVWDCSVTGAADDGLAVEIEASNHLVMEVDGCRFDRIAGAAASLTMGEGAEVRYRIEKSRFLDAGQGVSLTVRDSARLSFQVVENQEFSEIEGTIFNLFVDPDATSAARVSGAIEGNHIMSKKPGSGFGIRLSCNGDGKTNAAVRDNGITGGVEADFGILAEARLGRGSLDLELTDNRVEVGTEALSPIFIRSRDEVRLCARIRGNHTSGAGSQPGLRLQQRGQSVFALADLGQDGHDPAVIEARLAAANPGVGGAAATADEGFTSAPDGCAAAKERIQ